MAGRDECCGLDEHVMRPATGECFEGIWRGCDTAWPDRNNYLGFHAVWPGITGADQSTPLPSTDRQLSTPSPGPQRNPRLPLNGHLDTPQ